MSRMRKLIPREVQTAQQRVNGMISVEPRLDLGNGISVESMTAEIKAVTDGINEYNTLLATLDEKSNLVEDSIKRLRDLTKRTLAGAEFKYGTDSNEYEMIGGTRQSDRKRAPRNNKGGTGEMK